MHDYYYDSSSNYNDYDVLNIKRKNKYKKYVVFVIIIFILIMGLIIFNKMRSYQNTYSYYEKKMVSAARDYISENKISVLGEIYLDVSKLDVQLPSNCNLTSGVIYDGNEYNAYLSCSDYESNITSDNNEIKLLGKKVNVIAKGMTFYDPGYESDNKVSVNGVIGKEEGVYNIYYIGQNSSNIALRKVIIIDNDKLNSLFPNISLIGDVLDTIIKNENYKDKGTIAIDSIDGDITNKVVKYGSVNENTLGEYKIVYSITNSMGYTSSIMRNVVVIDNTTDIKVMSGLSDENLTNDPINIIFNIIGSSYDYTILPDKTKIFMKNFEYTVKENGVYQFQIVDKSGKITNHEVEVNNIDRSAPTGTCVATLYNDRTEITVNITSRKSIMGYNYYVDESSSGYTISNSYISSIISPSSVKVGIKDVIGNENKINCSTVDKQTKFDPDGIRKVFDTTARLRIPIGTALANKGHTITDLNMCIYNRVKEAGVGTRYGVVAAAVGLVECTYNLTGYVLSYNHESGKVETEGGINYCAYNSDICGKLGINTRWGSKGGACPTAECFHGLNCATFVRWAMCNGGMDLCSRGTAGAFSMTSITYFPEADGVIVNGNSVRYYSGNNLTNYSASQLVRMIQPGDIVALESNNDTNGGSQHTFVVIGRDSTGIYTANDGYWLEKLTYSEMLNGQKYYRILFLDNYYANPANKNNLYD